MKTGYYKETPIKSVDGYESKQSYKVVIRPTHTGKLCMFKSILSKEKGVEFSEHMGYVTFKDEQDLRESFDVVILEDGRA